MGGRGLVCLVVCVACGGSSSGKPPDAAADGPPGSGHTISVTLTDRPNSPATFTFLAAYEDGTGPWQLAPAPSGDTYSFSVTSATWSFAWTCLTADSRDVTMYSFAVAERTSLADQVLAGCTDRNPTPIALSGTISNAPAAGTIGVAWGDRSVDASGATYTFAPGVPAGTHDLVAAHQVGSASSYVVDSVVVQPGVAVAAGTTKAIDFASAHATQPATITGVPSNALVFTGVETAGGTGVTLSYYTSAPSGGYQAVGLAASQAQAGDLYSELIAEPISGADVAVEAYESAPGPLTYVSPAPLTGASSSVAATAPYPQIETTWTAYPGATGYTWSLGEPLTAVQCGGSMPCSVDWGAYLSPGAVGASPRFRMPDLSTLPGWDPRFGLQPGAMGALTLSGSVSSAGPGDFPPALAPAAGTIRKHARSSHAISL